MSLFTRYFQSIRLATSMAFLLMVAFSTPAAAQLDNAQDQIFPNCDHPDFPALMSFYASTNGPNWLRNDGWAEGAAGENCEPCDWWGVDCDAAGRVVVIKLPFNRLTDQLPENLGDFPFLTGLVLQGNGLSGQIPFSIGDLSQLRILDISKNKLSGYIPPEIGEPALLRIILLDNNDITGVIPQELADLDQLQVLRLNDNHLSCVYDELEPLCSVPDLDFSNNPLLPWEGDFAQYCAGETQIGAPCNGDDVILGYCECGPPPPACHPDLDALMALYNSTDGANWNNNDGWIDGAAGTNCAPCSWYGITCDSDDRVEELALIVNNLNGSLPGEIGNLSALEKLIISFSEDLTGEIPAEITNLSNLEQLILLGGGLTGPIPGNIDALTNLRILNLAFNELSGPVPSSIGNLPSLDRLLLTANQLSGPIPEQISNATSVRQISLSFNELTGTIPATIGNMTNLEILSLIDNQLTGDIPEQIGNATALEKLQLSINALTGGIPASFNALTNLTDLVAYDNNLDGTIEADFSNSDALTDIWLQNNQLTGPIPPELADAESLEIIRLNNNQLTGPIPAALAQLSELTVLEVSDNNLSDCIENLSVWCDGTVPSEVIDYSGNLMLPWFGDAEQVCANDPGTPAPCDQDGDPTTDDEGIVNEFCECGPADGAAEDDRSKSVRLEDKQAGKPTKNIPPTVNQLFVYPNPVGDERLLRLFLPDAEGGYQIDLRSTSGQLVMNRQYAKNSLELDLSGVAPGLYIVSAQSSTDRWAQKVVVR